MMTVVVSCCFNVEMDVDTSVDANGYACEYYNPCCNCCRSASSIGKQGYQRHSRYRSSSYYLLLRPRARTSTAPFLYRISTLISDLSKMCLDVFGMLGPLSAALSSRVCSSLSTYLSVPMRNVYDSAVRMSETPCACLLGLEYRSSAVLLLSIQIHWLSTNDRNLRG